MVLGHLVKVMLCHRSLNTTEQTWYSALILSSITGTLSYDNWFEWQEIPVEFSFSGEGTYSSPSTGIFGTKF